MRNHGEVQLIKTNDYSAHCELDLRNEYAWRSCLVKVYLRIKGIKYESGIR